MKHRGLAIDIKLKIKIIQKRMFHLVIRGLPYYRFLAVDGQTIG